MHTLPPNLMLGAGAMKAGTTWLAVVLATHPRLRFTPEKELCYFSDRQCEAAGQFQHYLNAVARKRRVWDTYMNLDPEKTSIHWLRDRVKWCAAYLDSPTDDRWYSNLFDLPEPDLFACDFSNLYAQLTPESWRSIRTRTGNLRVLYTMRDPIKRLWSHVRFELAIKKKLGELASWTEDELVAFASGKSFADPGEYGQALGRLRSALDPWQVLPIFFEDVRKDPAGQLARIEDHLGIGHHVYDPALLDSRINEAPPVPMPPWFAEAFSGMAQRVAAELRDLGIEPPTSWTVR